MADLLEAINIMLVARGVTPISDADSGHPDVQSAKAILERHKRGVNTRKWFYNTEQDVDLSPDEYGKIKVPARVISLDNDQNYIIMQGYLYSMTDRTNVFEDAVEGLTLIYNREWEDMPIQAYDLVVAIAKEEFIRNLESSIMSGQAEKDITRCRAYLDIAQHRFDDVGKQSGNPLMVKWQQKMITR